LDYNKACDQQFTLTTKKSLHITFKTVFVHVLSAEQGVGNIEMIATSPLTDGQLNATLDQQVKSPNRVFSTPACYSAVSVGFPDCVSVLLANYGRPV